MRRRIGMAFVTLALLVCVLGGAAAWTSINGAVIASGQVAVASGVKRVQHPSGGVVAAIQVKNGSRVNTGDVLLSLDSVATGAGARIITDAIAELSAKQARLEAELESRPNIGSSTDPSLQTPTGRAAWDSERRLFDIRRRARAGAKAQLMEQRAQIEQQIHGYEDVAKSKQQQIALIENELAGVRRLFAENLVPIARLNALERDAVQLRGDVGALAANVAEARAKISEIDVSIIQVDQNARAEAGSQLSDLQNQLSELKQKRITVQQELKRIDLRSPQDGVVDRLAVNTVGGVISPGETVMLIVPDKDKMTVEVRIQPNSIDKVHVGQSAMMRFTAFDQRTTPEISGAVQRVSAEAQLDEKTGLSFYTATLSVDASALRRPGLKLVPGMPVEVFIETDRRTILSYLTKPLVDQIRRMFRE